MRAAIIHQFGNPEVLTVVTDYPEPNVQENQVVIRVHAAGVNPLDWHTRRGELQLIRGKKFPMILGNDVAGVVVQRGRKVTQFQEGDQVYGMIDPNSSLSWTKFTQCGAYAELAVTREETLARKPDSLSYEEAAAIPLACLTAYQALLRKARLQPGDTILINGASGGVGVFAVQLAKAWGATVTAVCSESNRELVAQLGADTIINYQKEHITDLQEQFDCIYDVAVTTSFSQCRHLLTERGVFISNLVNPFNLASSWLFPVLRVVGCRKYNTFAFVVPSGADLQAISLMIQEQRLRPIIDTVYALHEIREAHKYSESGHVRGKIVVNICEQANT